MPKKILTLLIQIIFVWMYLWTDRQIKEICVFGKLLNLIHKTITTRFPKISIFGAVGVAPKNRSATGSHPISIIIRIKTSSYPVVVSKSFFLVSLIITKLNWLSYSHDNTLSKVTFFDL